MRSPEISVAEAKQDKLFYVVSNLAIINIAEATCLLLKRGPNEKVLPNKWCFAGGKLEHQDVKKLLEETGRQPIDGIENILGLLGEREAREESGLDIDSATAQIITNKVFVRPDGVPVFMATLAAAYTGGTVKLEDQAFSDYAWAHRDELDSYDCIDSVREEAVLAFDALGIA